MGDNNTWNMMTYNDTCLTVEISDIIISEALSFNISHKPRFIKLLDLVADLVETTWLTRYTRPMKIMYNKVSEFIGREFKKT